MDDVSEKIQCLVQQWEQHISPMLRTHRSERGQQPIRWSGRLKERFERAYLAIFGVEDGPFPDPGAILFKRGSEFIDRLFPYVLPPADLRIHMRGKRILSRRAEALQGAEAFYDLTLKLRSLLKQTALLDAKEEHDANGMISQSAKLNELASCLEDYVVVLDRKGARAEAQALFGHVRVIRDHAVNCGDLAGEVSFAADRSLHAKVCNDLFAADAEMERSERIAKALLNECENERNDARHNMEYIRLALLEDCHPFLTEAMFAEIEEVLGIPYAASAARLRPYLTGEYIGHLNSPAAP